MAEALVFLDNNTHVDAVKDRRGCWKRGMIVVVKDDNHTWGAQEHPATASPRKFALLKFPGVTVARVEKYIAAQLDGGGDTFRRRLWQIQYSELPLAARNTLASTGILTIGASGDYTWTQVKGFFARLDDNTRETETL